MKKILWVSLWVFLFLGNASAQVSVTTVPPMDQIKPDADLVETTIQIPPDSSYEIFVRTPPSHWWISTDFPMVENTLLYHFRGFSKTGTVQFKTIYPIRGEYPIELLVNGTKHQVSIQLNETPAELVNMGIFLAALFVIGIVGGQIFLRGAQAKSVSVGFALFFAVLVFPGMNEVYGGHPAPEHKNENWVEKDGIYELQVQFDSGYAVVGDQVDFKITLLSQGKKVEFPYSVEIKTFHMEDETIMFHGEFEADAAETLQTMQFFDGAETKTTFTVFADGKQLVSANGVIDVAGIDPPTSVVVKTMILLSFVLLGGMAIGFFLIPGRKLEPGAVS